MNKGLELLEKEFSLDHRLWVTITRFSEEKQYEGGVGILFYLSILYNRIKELLENKPKFKWSRKAWWVSVTLGDPSLVVR